MNHRTIFLLCLAACLAAPLAFAQDAPQRPRSPQRLAADQPQLPSDKPVSQVEVVNFPPVQTVTGGVDVTNLPAVQPVSGSVSCSNLPLDEDGNVRVTAPAPGQTWTVMRWDYVSPWWEPVYTDWLDVSAYSRLELIAAAEGPCRNELGQGYHRIRTQWRFADDAPIFNMGETWAEGDAPLTLDKTWGKYLRVEIHNICAFEGQSSLVHLWVAFVK